MKIIDFYANTTEQVLQHKLKDGMRSSGAYCFWSRRSRYWDLAEYLQKELGNGRCEFWIWKDYIPPEDKHNIRNVYLDFEVRLHIAVDEKEKGYFVCFGANKKFTELWFHSEDWVAV